MDPSKPSNPMRDDALATSAAADGAAGGADAGGARLRYSTDWAHAEKPAGGMAAKKPKAPVADAAFLRAENEDDDGYDPYSDRRPASAPLFERDPWD